MEENKVLLTQEGYNKLQEELAYLKGPKKMEVAAKIKEAKEFGDLSENSEYDEAKNEQAKIEVQISELEETIAHAKVISDHDIQTDVVNVGVTVTIYDMDFNEEMSYTIVSSREVDPLNNYISDQSPIGRALIGTKVGDIVTVEIPDGFAKFRVTNIAR